MNFYFTFCYILKFYYFNMFSVILIKGVDYKKKLAINIYGINYISFFYFITNKINGTTIRLTSFTKNYENIPSFSDIRYIGVFTKLPKKVYLSQ